MPTTGSHPDTDGISTPAPSAPGLSPRLEAYLPPDLWQALTAGDPGRRELLKAVERLRSLRYLLATYLPSHLAQELIQDPAPGRVRGEMLDGSLLFADVSGFTALSERLATQGREGAERLTEMINRYFDAMIDILAWSGGILLKFAGDALLVYFPAQEGQRHAHWAVRAGLRMMEAMADFSQIETPLGSVALRMKIGISTGRFAAASVGSAKRMEYVVLGDAVANTMAAEGAAEAGQVVADRATAAAHPPSQVTELADGFYLISQPSGQEIGRFEVTAGPGGRERGTPLLASVEQLAADLHQTLRQIEALRAFIPADLVERIVARTGQRSLESEFRPVAVIFVNFTGLERLLPILGLDGPGETGALGVVRMLSDYFSAVHRVISEHGGVITRIDPYKGSSKMLILFGAPVTHEDDPQRAVRAALNMRTELATLNGRWRRALARHLPGDLDSPLIQQRIGITLGLTFAGQAGSATRREYTVMGDDVNLSARLMGAAQPDQILLSESLHQAVAGRFRLSELQPIRVKGKSEPIPIYQAEGLRADQLERRLQSRGPLLGRDPEREACRKALRQALAGRGTTLSIQGPAGIGKSHLADALMADALAAGARVTLSESASYAAAAPFSAWISLLQAIVGIEESDSAEIQGEKLLAILTDLDLAQDRVLEPLFNLLNLASVSPPAALRRLERDRAEPPGPAGPGEAAPSLFGLLGQRVDRVESGPNIWQLIGERVGDGAGRTWQHLGTKIAEREGRRLLDAISGLLEGLAAETPLVLVFEDTQWMDAMSLALLDHLNERIGRWPVLILPLRRQEEGSDSPGDGRVIMLAPLEPEGTGSLVAYLLQERVPSDHMPALVQAIHEASGGNPLLIEEIVRWLERTGYESLETLRTGLRASSTLQELVISRLDDLPPAERSTARAASVLGGNFESASLAPLLPKGPELDALAYSLDELHRAHLTFLVESHPDARYTFRQTLVRELIYDTLPFAQRRELHRRLAAHLEARYANHPAPPAELLAHHYQLSGQPLPAARHLLISGHRARQRYAYAQAGAIYGRILEVLEGIPAGDESPDSVAIRLQAHEGQGDVALLTGEYQAAATAYETARSFLPETDSPQAAGALRRRLLLKQALVLAPLGRPEEAERCARATLDARPAAENLAAAAILAWLSWRAGSDQAEAHIQQARSLVTDSGDRWETAISALLTDLAGKWAQARRAYLSLNQPTGAALAACCQGDWHLDRGEIRQALDLYRQAAETWGQENDAWGLALVSYRTAEAYWRRSEGMAASGLLSQALALLEGAEGVEEDRRAVQSALAAIESGLRDPWRTRRWQSYDDAFRISLLFRP
jgi:class 3 adenylate cyclase/tetratricopeptide (TPR) repeat protein